MKTLQVVVFAGLALCGAANAEPVNYEIPYENETAILRPGDGVEVAEANCGTCHSADYINYQPPGKGAKFWEAEVHKWRSPSYSFTDDDENRRPERPHVCAIGPLPLATG